jgi:hypothetical protein
MRTLSSEHTSKELVRALSIRISLKVHKIANFFGSDFEFCTFSLLVLLSVVDPE